MEENNSLFTKLRNKFKNADIKTLIKTLTLFFGIVLIVLMTVAHVGLDPNQLDLSDWISKTILMIGISIFGIIMGELIGSDKQMADTKGLYQTSMRNYKNIHDAIKPISLYFNEFLLWYTKKEMYNAKITYLLDNGLTDAEEIIKYVSLEDLEELEKHPLKYEDDIIIRQKTKEQIKHINYVLSGKINIKAKPSSYYLNAYHNISSYSQLSVGTHIEHKETFNKVFGRTFKIISSVFISAVLAMVTVQDFMSGGDVSAWVDLTIRITTVFTCFFSGWLTACIDVKLKAQLVQHKTEILETFSNSYETKEFVPTNYKNLAREEYNQYIDELEKQKEEPIINDLKNREIIEEETKEIGDLKEENNDGNTNIE